MWRVSSMALSLTRTCSGVGPRSRAAMKSSHAFGGSGFTCRSTMHASARAALCAFGLCQLCAPHVLWPTGRWRPTTPAAPHCHKVNGAECRLTGSGGGGEREGCRVPEGGGAEGGWAGHRRPCKHCEQAGDGDGPPCMRLPLGVPATCEQACAHSAHAKAAPAAPRQPAPSAVGPSTCFLPHTTESSVYKIVDRPPRMVLRYVRPLPPEAWKDFLAALERGPTPEQVRFMEEAKKLTLHMVQSRDQYRKEKLA